MSQIHTSTERQRTRPYIARIEAEERHDKHIDVLCIHLDSTTFRVESFFLNLSCVHDPLFL